MQDENDVLKAERLDERLEVARMVLDPVGDVGFVRAPHPDQVGSDAPRLRRDMGDDVAPEIGLVVTTVPKVPL